MNVNEPLRRFSFEILLTAYLFLSLIINGVTYFSGRVPNDLRNVYVGAKMVVAGGNPYDDAALKAAWIQITREQGITGQDSATAPGLPVPLLYSPNALGFYVPFSLVPWKIVVPLSRLLSLAGIILLTFFLWKARQTSGTMRPPLALLLLALMALNGTSWIVTQANPAALSSLFIALSFHAFVKKRAAVSGLWLGLAAIKATLAFPLFLFMLAKKQYTAFAVAALTACIPLLAFAGHGGVVDAFGAWLASTQDFSLRLLSLSPLNDTLWHGYDMWKSSHELLDYTSPIGPIISFYLHRLGLQFNPAIIGYAAYGLYGAAALYLMILAKRNRIQDIPLIVSLFCLEFLCNYHLLYDGIILIGFLALIFTKFTKKRQLAIVLVTSILFLPYNGAFIRLGVPKELYLFLFNIPLMLVAISMITLLRDPPDHRTSDSRPGRISTHIPSLTGRDEFDGGPV